MQNPFDQFDAPVKSGPILGPAPKVDPYKARDQQLQEERFGMDQSKNARDAQLDAVRLENEQLKLQQTQAELAKKAQSSNDSVQARAELQAVIDAAQKAKGLSKDGWFATGFGADSARGYGGTTANDVAGLLDVIGSNAAFDRLQKMRNESPTGGALGSITERELALLQSTVASLNQSQSDSQFQEQMDKVIERYQAILDKIPSDEQKQDVPEGAEPLFDAAGKALGYIGQDGVATFFFDTPPPPQDTPPSPPDNGGLMNGFMNGVGDIVETVGDTVGLLNNPVNAGVNALFGTDLTTDLGKSLRGGLGLPDNGNPYAKAINQGGVSAMTGTGLGTLARNAPGAAGVVANALTQQPVAQVAGGVTGAVSAEGAKQAGLPWPVQLGAALLGGATGGGATNALLNTGKKVPNQVAQAAQNQQIALMPADVGGPMVKRLSAAASQGAVSAGSVTKAAQNSQNQFRNAAQRASSGNRLAPDDAGEVVRSAGERFVKGSQQKGGALYTRAEKLAQGVSIKAKGAIQTIDDQIAELSQAAETNAPLIQELQKFRADLANNAGVKVAGMRDLRTAAQKAAYTDSLRSTPAKRVLGIVAQSISDDIDAGLQQAGRGNAAAAFKTADTYWRDRVEYIDSVLEPIIGKGKSGESIVQAVQSMAEGKGKGVQTLMKLMRSVEKDELADIQATVIDRLGKSTAGQQNAEGTGYSSATFLTNWSKMSEKGRIALFPDPALRKNLNELAMIADNMKQSSRYANSSQTAGAIAGQVVLSGGLGMASPTALLLAGGSQYLSGRLLASPKFANWLATVPKNPAAQQAHVKRLGAIAASEPVIANDILSVQKFLSQAPSTAKAAAGEQVNEERPE